MKKDEKTKLEKAWFTSAIEDLATAKGLFTLKRYSGSLFFCHLTIEKVLKALFLKRKDDYPPPTHKLVRLAKLSEIKLDKETEIYLAEITTFNIEARYDVLKEKLYKKATRKFTQKYLKITKKIFTDFKKLI